MSEARLRVGIIGCGLIGAKRAVALGPEDRLIGCVDPSAEAATRLAAAHGAQAFVDIDLLLDMEPDVVIVATPHDQLAPLAERALQRGAHVLVEKPGGMGSKQIERLSDVASRTDRVVKVGFNHRFHPALARAAAEVHSGSHGPLMYVRAHYGHGGRPGYEAEWRANPVRSGGGELIDQGMHLLDLIHWVAGALPLYGALLRTQFWNVAVEDNAALLLGDPDERTAPWAMLHASWTEWKNTFSFELYCTRAKLQVDGLVGSYGTQRLRIYRMPPELGPPDLEEVNFSDEDASWAAEWEHLVSVIVGESTLLGSLDDAHYAWSRTEEAYSLGPFAGMREGLGG